MNIKELNEQLDKFLLESAWKNACGIELTKQIADNLRQKYTNLPELKSNNIDAKISWLIKYIDIVPKQELIGLKVSNIGKIEYTEQNTNKKEWCILAIGDTDINNKIKLNTRQGLYHMKYGDSKHWQKSKEALHLIPTSLKQAKQMPGKTQYKYELIYKPKNIPYTYVVGVPSDKGDETVLITCL